MRLRSCPTIVGYLSGRLHDQAQGFVYVLHCFQKNPGLEIKTPKRDLELIRRRLAEAELHFNAMIGREE